MTDTLRDNNYTDVTTITASEFFNEKKKISLPDYQRPYVWNNEKIEQLFTDFKEHFFNDRVLNENNIQYYIGTILLFKKSDNNYEIIDGQQRITTLLLINHAFKQQDSYLNTHNWKLEYNSLISSKTIKSNYDFISTYYDKALLSNRLQHIFDNLVFTKIETNSEDEAFTFFDSQNNRGVSLSAIDFLKSYHLRELKGKENLQRAFASKWDKNNKDQFLNELFNLILWRNREWKGKSLNFENKDAILNSFQKKTIKNHENNEVIKLYPNIFNSLSKHLEYDSNNGATVHPNPLNLQTTAEQYPFSIRQPIQKGVGFFLYTEKYHAIYLKVFDNEEFKEFNRAFNTLFGSVSYYFVSMFKLLSVSFYDKFKDDKLVEFALWLDYLLGSYRINQHTIVAQTVIKILRENPQNILDVIEMSYRPQDVFEYLQKITNNDWYDKKIDTLGTENGVRNRYRKNNLEFYKEYTNGEEKLTEKKNWINSYLSNGK